jgi:hypothetical protein
MTTLDKLLELHKKATDWHRISGESYIAYYSYVDGNQVIIEKRSHFPFNIYKIMGGSKYAEYRNDKKIKVAFKDTEKKYFKR